jgi:lambda family phage holin
LSFVLALFRTVYDEKEPRWVRRLTEAAMCGMITLSAGYGIDAMGLAGEWKYAAAGAIGFLGADYIRTVAKKFVGRKIEPK